MHPRSARATTVGVPFVETTEEWSGGVRRPLPLPRDLPPTGARTHRPARHPFRALGRAASPSPASLWLAQRPATLPPCQRRRVWFVPAVVSPRVSGSWRRGLPPRLPSRRPAAGDLPAGASTTPTASSSGESVVTAPAECTASGPARTEPRGAAGVAAGAGPLAPVRAPAATLNCSATAARRRERHIHSRRRRRRRSITSASCASAERARSSARSSCHYRDPATRRP